MVLQNSPIIYTHPVLPGQKYIHFSMNCHYSNTKFARIKELIITGVLISPYSDPTVKTIERSHFSSDAEVIAAAETSLDGQTSECFFFELPAEVRVWSL